MKPHKGRIIFHSKSYYDVGKNSQYIIIGEFVDHPIFAGNRGHTSLVEHESPPNKNGVYEIETLNSRYTIVPKGYSVADEGSKPQQ